MDLYIFHPHVVLCPVGLSGRLCLARAGGELLVCIYIYVHIYLYIDMFVCVFISISVCIPIYGVYC